jgi:hypothetical protein
MSKTKSLFADVKQPASIAAGRGRGKRPLKRKADLKDLRSLVGDVRDEDGIDPRDLARHRSRNPDRTGPGQAHGTHRQEQFLSQVHTAIDAALQSAATPILNSLAVQDVARYGGSVLVVLAPQTPEIGVDIQAANAALERASSMLTREVAAAITRKDVPHLSFVVLPASAKRVDE